MKLCIHCKHHREIQLSTHFDGTPFSAHVCAVDFRRCEAMRKSGAACGPEADLFLALCVHESQQIANLRDDRL